MSPVCRTLYRAEAFCAEAERQSVVDVSSGRLRQPFRLCFCWRPGLRGAHVGFFCWVLLEAAQKLAGRVPQAVSIVCVFSFTN